jgi:hypothetical protein
VQIKSPHSPEWDCLGYGGTISVDSKQYLHVLRVDRRPLVHATLGGQELFSGAKRNCLRSPRNGVSDFSCEPRQLSSLTTVDLPQIPWNAFWADVSDWVFPHLTPGNPTLFAVTCQSPTLALTTLTLVS